jgi:hypothetical protein
VGLLVGVGVGLEAGGEEDGDAVWAEIAIKGNAQQNKSKRMRATGMILTFFGYEPRFNFG